MDSNHGKPAMKELRIFFDYWEDGGNYIPLITVELGIKLCKELERVESHTYEYSSYDEKYKWSEFIKAAYKQACERYPMAMERARYNYLRGI